ncbi:MAG: M48 family metalloprotease [Prevotella sp.]|jgi:putative metalloprotease|nr:M48 family metalloprotease [Prevotella sp.]
MKKMFFASALLLMTALNADAQFGKLLKKVEKAATTVANSAAGDIAADLALNTLSDNIVAYMDKNNTVLAEDSPYTTRLAALVQPNYTNVDGLGIYYKVYENPEVNILACADGCIRVYTGLMDAFNDDELLAIIATQIGHIANKDARNALLKVTKKDNASKAAYAQLDKTLSGEGLATIVNELLQVPYTNEQNIAADKFAVALLQKNGAGTNGLVSALDKLSKLEALETEDGTSITSKFLKVNSNNATRLSLLK